MGDLRSSQMLDEGEPPVAPYRCKPFFEWK